MPDAFHKHVSGLESPATHVLEITPDDLADLALATRAIAVSETGFVRITTVDGSQGRIFVVAGVPFPIRVSRIWATGTSATGIVGLS